MRLWVWLLLPLVTAPLVACTELVRVGYECPDRQRHCDPEQPPEQDAGPRPERDATPDATPLEAGMDGEDAGVEEDASADADTAPPEPAPLIRQPSFEPDEPSNIVDGILQLLDIQTVPPWEACWDLRSLPSVIQVVNVPRNPVTQMPDESVEPAMAADGDYFVQFSATLDLNGFGKATQPLSREVRAGEEIALTFRAAATEGNDEVFVRILGSESRCANEREQQTHPPQVLYESTTLPDDEGWLELHAVLQPESSIHWITITGDTTGSFNFSLTSPQLFFDHIEEELPVDP